MSCERYSLPMFFSICFSAPPVLFFHQNWKISGDESIHALKPNRNYTPGRFDYRINDVTRFLTINVSSLGY
jgi:hypothetical protein